MIGLLKSIARRILKIKLHSPNSDHPYVFLGSEYGGWPLVKGSTSSSSIIYSFGLGTDVSFDIEAIKKFDCQVIGFDPTPRSITWLSTQKLPANFTYHQTGIAPFDGDAEFFLPKHQNHVSFSSQSADPEAEAVMAPVRRLSSIIGSGLPTPDIVKMDIEGFEYDVIDDILASSFKPKQLLIEFHHGMYGIKAEKTKKAVQDIMRAGYDLFFVSKVGREYGFILSY